MKLNLQRTVGTAVLAVSTTLFAAPEQRQAQGQADSTRYQLTPDGWISIGVDYDRDGRFDAVENIYVYDLEQAQQSSRQRAERGGTGSGSTASSQTESVQGQIRELRRERLTGFQEEQVLARVETESGQIAKVLLGPQNELRRLRLKEGDRIQVTGVLGRINDRPILIARQVQHGDQQVSVNLRPGGLERLRGQILETRTTQHNGTEHMEARIRLDNGDERTVQLGPPSQVASLNLRRGDRVCVLARPSPRGDQDAVVAEQIHSKGRMVTLDTTASRLDSAAMEPMQQRMQQRMQEHMQGMQQHMQGMQQRMQPSQQPLLGVQVQETEDRPGVEVQSVQPGSPAEQVGLREGDEVLSINGARVESREDVIEALRDVDTAERIQLRYRRNGLLHTTEVQLAQRNGASSERIQ